MNLGSAIGWRNAMHEMLVPVLLGLSLMCAAGQELAITEVMSSASTNLGTTYVGNGSDFWELTNFGTNTIHLDGYHYADNLDSPRQPLVNPGDPPLDIHPGESIIFVRYKETTNEAHFRAWWGLPPDMPVVRIVSKSPGFDGASDRLSVYDDMGNLVDRVNFGIARRGFTFISDTNTGEFGIYSVPGECGTFKAATADDYGSPGLTCGPVPLRLIEQPSSQTVCAGMDATFRVRAAGLPRPKYRWFFNGSLIPGAVSPAFTISPVGPANVGQYYVEAYNYSGVLRSTNVTLSVNTNPVPPTIVVPPSDLTVIIGQTARFSVKVCAYPLPTFQWLSNGFAIPGATSPTLVLPNCQPGMSETVYCAWVQNSNGYTFACGRLTVIPRPNLRITELMAYAGTNCSAHQDWFEITNNDTNSVNLLGYRFADRMTLESAPKINQPIILKPRESAIFVERMTPEAFRQWWGPANLPPGLQIYTYTGLGFSSEGGEIYLWNGAADDPGDTIDSRSYSYALQGVSRYFDDLDCFDGCHSGTGKLDAYRSAECGDIGSPGTTADSAPWFASITHGASDVTLRWRAVQGRTYQIYGIESLGRGGPNLVTNFRSQNLGHVITNRIVATNWLQTTKDGSLGIDRTRFYLLEELP